MLTTHLPRLRKMDSEDAPVEAYRLGLEDAAAECHNMAFDQRRHKLTRDGAFMCKATILALASSLNKDAEHG